MKNTSANGTKKNKDFTILGAVQMSTLEKYGGVRWAKILASKSTVRAMFLLDRLYFYVN